MTSNVSATSTTGLYGISGNVFVPNSAQQLLNLLYNNGNVNFSLANSGTQVQANALVSGGGGSGTYGNSNVAAYLASNTDPTISNLNSNAAVQAININFINANIGAFETYANLTFSTQSNAASQQTQIDTLNANVGAFETYANLTFGTSNYSNVNVAAYLSSNTDPTISNLNANAAVQATAINTLNANVGAYETWANVTFSTVANAAVQATAIDTLNANLGAYQTFANANVSSLQNQITGANVNIQTLNANVGAYETWANSTFLTSTTGVSQIVAGANIAISPAGGQGAVTISQIGGVAPLTSTGYYGSFYDTTNQYAPSATTAYTVGINSTIGTNGVTLSSNAMSFSYSGVYQVAFSIQFINTDNTQHEANVWLTQNGTPLNNTTSQITIAARGNPSQPGTTLMTVPLVVTVNAGDTIGLQWQTNAGSTAVSIASLSAGLSPTRPAIPGVIVYATQVTSVTGNQYGNSNVATFLGSGFGSNTITTSGAVTAGNLITTNGVFWSNGVAYSSGGGTYGNTQVAAYNNNTYGLFADVGAIRLNGVASSFNTVALNATTISLGPDLGSATVNLVAPMTTYYPIYLGGIGSGVQNGNLVARSTANITLASGSNLNAQSGSGIRLDSGATFLASTGTFTGVLTAGNITTTNGLYWANGVSYASTVTGTNPIFSGDLLGNILTDSTNLRTFANANPLSTGAVNVANNTTSKYMVYKPVYTGGQLQQPPLANATTGGTTIVATSGQTIGFVQSANVGLQSGYAFGAQNRDTIGSLFSTTITPVTANSMANQDRVRSSISSIDLVINGQTYGTMSSSSQTATTLTALSGATNINGYGSIAVAAGATLGAFITPTAAQTANVQYVTGALPFLSMLATAGTTGKANVVYSRGVAPFITGFSSNLVVQNAVGLHTTSGWAGTTLGTGSATGAFAAYAVLNEDTATQIQTNGNIIVTGNTRIRALQETVFATGFTGGAWTANVAAGTIQTATLTSNITSLSFTNMPAGGTVTLIITQGGSGSYTLSTTGIKYAGGSNTLSTAVGAIDMLNVLFDGTNYYGSLVKGYA
jgi:hypothetical protein